MRSERNDVWERLLLALCLTLMVVVAAACQPPPSEPLGYTRLAPARLHPGDRLPQPEEIALTVTGKLGNPNRAGTAIMDAASIEAAGLIEYQLGTPYAREPIAYRGALLADLLALWAIAPDATALEFQARDGYRIAMPLAELAELPVAIATRQNNRPLPAEFAPLVLVWPYSHSPLQQPAADQFWVKQLTAIAIQ